MKYISSYVSAGVPIPNLVQILGALEEEVTILPITRNNREGGVGVRVQIGVVEEKNRNHHVTKVVRPTARNMGQGRGHQAHLLHPQRHPALIPGIKRLLRIPVNY